MKGLTVLLLLALPCLSYPQGVFTNQTNTTLQAVLNDYPVGFKNIKGALVNKDPQSADFTSRAELPGAVQTVITQYSTSGDKEVYSWKCLVLQTEEFDIAEKKYKELFGQLSNSIIKIDGQKPYILSGEYNPPTDEKKFNSSSLRLLPPAPGELAHAKVEIVMEYYVTEWKINLLVYDQEEESLVLD